MKRMSTATKVDRLFFHKIDTPSKAWCLGLMFSDGNVSSSDNTISLSMKDIDVIEKFKKCILSDKLILKYGVSPIMYRLAVSSLKLKNDLIKHGCTPRKSLTLQFPKTVPDHLIRHFIRGYFDGDGWITNTDKTINVGFVGTKAIMDGIAAHLISNGIRCNKSYRCSTINENSYSLNMKSRITIVLLYKYMYGNLKGCRIRMDRKYSIFVDAVKDINNMNNRPPTIFKGGTRNVITGRFDKIA